MNYMIHNAARGSHTPESQVKIGNSPTLLASCAQAVFEAAPVSLRDGEAVVHTAVRRKNTGAIALELVDIDHQDPLAASVTFLAESKWPDGSLHPRHLA
jgi:hypothetical protein